MNRYFIFLLFLTVFSYGQDFTVDIQVTHATCPSNGAFTFSALDSGGNPISDNNIEYHIYKLPDVTNPITPPQGASNPYFMLSSGEYRVVAIYNGDTSNAQVYEPIVVEDHYTEIEINAEYKVQCGNDAEITVNVLSGNVVFYELLYEVVPYTDIPIPGSYSAPPQTSNVFSNLPAFGSEPYDQPGVRSYVVVASDSCGESRSFTVNIIYNPLSSIGFIDNFVKLVGDDCTEEVFVSIEDTILFPIDYPNSSFPLTITYIIYPPASSGDEPIIYTEIVEGPPEGEQGEIEGGAADGEVSGTVHPNGPVPYYPGEIYYYDLIITNACGTSYSIHQPIDVTMKAWWNYTNTECYGIDIFVENFVGDIKVNFIDYPEGFNPNVLNENHSVFSSDTFTTYAEGIAKITYAAANLKWETDPVTGEPLPGQFLAGDYYVQIINECEGEVLSTFDLGFVILEEVTLFEGKMNLFGLPPILPGCEERGRALLLPHIVNLSEVYMVKLSEAPPSFIVENQIVPPPESVYQDYLSYWEGIDLAEWEDISEGIKNFSSPLIPNDLRMLQYDFFGGPGWYGFKIIDICGNVFYIAKSMVVFPSEVGLMLGQSPNSCTEWSGSLGLEVGAFEHDGGVIAEAWLIDAPQEFKDFYNFTDADFPINLVEDFVFTVEIANPDGEPNPLIKWYLVMDNLPPGEYEIDILANCRWYNEKISVLDYQQTTDFELYPQCGSFCFKFNHTAPPSFWFYMDAFSLEWYNPNTAEWEAVIPFPDPYTPTIPIAVDSFMPNDIIKCSSLFNKPGEYRLLKRYYHYEKNSQKPQECIEVIHEFEYSTTPIINGVKNIACADGGSMLFIDAEGSGELSYYIWKGTPEAGGILLYGPQQSNIFTDINLAPGTYEIQVEGCGNAVVSSVFISEPESITVKGNNLCEGHIATLTVQNFSFLSYEWYHVVDGEEVFVGTGHQLVFDPFDENLHGGDYIVKITFIEDSDVACSQWELSYTLIKELPDFSIEGNTMICEDQYTTLSVKGNNFQNSEATFFWEYPNGETSMDSSVEVNQVGEYSVTITLDGCGQTQWITVTEKTDISVVMLDKGCIDSQYVLWVVNSNDFPDADFEWTGPSGFLEFGSIVNISEAGDYQVSITDSEGCVIFGEIYVSSTHCLIPKGISPNNDDLNDSFDLSNLNVQELQIFNRYGRTVYEAKNGYTNQWKGQTNDNKLLPSATYYYIVTFLDGSKKTGWVYLNRE